MKLTSKHIALLSIATFAATWGVYFALEAMLADDAAVFGSGAYGGESGWNGEPGKERDPEPPAQPEAAAPAKLAEPAAPGPAPEPPAAEPVPATAPAAEQPPEEEDEAAKAEALKEKLEAMAEQIDVMKERYWKLEERFTNEPRDASWARGKEDRVSRLFREADREKMLVSVECRTTLCRLETRVADSSEFFALLKLPGLKDEQTSESVTLPRGPADNRTVVNYFAKHGFTLERLAREQ